MCMFICTYTWPKKLSSVSGIISEIGILNIRRSFPAILTLQIYHHQSGIGGILTDVWQHKPSRRGDDDSPKLYGTDSTEQCLRMCFPDWVLHDLVVKIPFGLSGQFIKLFPKCSPPATGNLFPIFALLPTILVCFPLSFESSPLELVSASSVLEILLEQISPASCYMIAVGFRFLVTSFLMAVSQGWDLTPPLFQKFLYRETFPVTPFKCFTAFHSVTEFCSGFFSFPLFNLWWHSCHGTQSSERIEGM